MEYCDIPIKELTKLFKCTEENLEKGESVPQEYYRCFPYNCTPYCFNEDQQSLFYRPVTRVIKVDENMKPLYEYNNNIVIRRQGNFHSYFPCKNPENVLKAFQTMDNIIHGSDLGEVVPFWKVINIWAENETRDTNNNALRTEITENVKVYASIFLSVKPSESCWNAIFDKCTKWLSDNKLENMRFYLNQYESTYVLYIEVSNKTEVPFVSKPIQFISKQLVKKSSCENNMFSSDKSLFKCFRTEDDDTYIFSGDANETACGATYVTDTLPNYKVFEKRYGDFMRLIAHNNEVYELHFFRHPKYISRATKDVAKHITSSLEKLFDDTILDQLVDISILDNPIIRVINSSTGEVKISIPMSNDDMIFDKNLIHETLNEAWKNLNYLWPTWRTKYKLKSCENFVMFSDDALEIGTRIQIQSKF